MKKILSQLKKLKEKNDKKLKHYSNCVDNFQFIQAQLNNNIDEKIHQELNKELSTLGDNLPKYLSKKIASIGKKETGNDRAIEIELKHKKTKKKLFFSPHEDFYYEDNVTPRWTVDLSSNRCNFSSNPQKLKKNLSLLDKNEIKYYINSSKSKNTIDSCIKGIEKNIELLKNIKSKSLTEIYNEYDVYASD